jgi:hypothetical protein
VAVIEHAVPGIEHWLVQHLALQHALRHRLHQLQRGDRAVADIVHLAQGIGMRRQHAGQAAELLDQRLGDRLAVDARARQRQQQLDDLVVGEGVRALLQELVAQALAMAEIVRLVLRAFLSWRFFWRVVGHDVTRSRVGDPSLWGRA